MLHWLAGQKPPEDPDATGYTEPPETPAPVFAVRAFKHAIFGTPQANQPNGRRHSNTDHGRPKNSELKPTRPGMNRPKSASDALPLARQDGQPMSDPLSSPTKGILMTPGASAAKKKNVTFGDYVVDNEEKRPLKSGLPDDCPGKFPSPWEKPIDDNKKRDESPDKSRGRSKLTEAFEQARDESRKRKSKQDKRPKRDLEEDSDVPGEFAEPKSESGKYWKREYDIYRTNTQREVKKLITKQKAAKSFAQSKDTQCTEMADQLKQEQKKVESLEVKKTNLEFQMQDLEKKLHASQEAEKKHRDEIAMLKRQLGRRDTARPISSEGASAAPLEKRQGEQRGSQERPKASEAPLQRSLESQKASVDTDNAKAVSQHRPSEPDKPLGEHETSPSGPVQRPSEPYNPAAVSEQPKTNRPTLRARMKSEILRSQAEQPQLKSTDDIWAQLDSFRSSSLVESQKPDHPSVPSAEGRKVTGGTDGTPLRTLSVNTLSSGRNSERSSPGSLDVECKSQPDLERKDSKKNRRLEETRKDSPLGSPDLPPPPPAHRSNARPTESTRSSQRKLGEEKNEDLSIQVPPSSSFLSEAKPSGPRGVPEPKPTLPNNTKDTKENVSPTSKTHTPQNELNVKPSAMWSSINGVQTGNRSASMTGKDGREVSLSRLEAARARIAARREAA